MNKKMIFFLTLKKYLYRKCHTLSQKFCDTEKVNMPVILFIFLFFLVTKKSKIQRMSHLSQFF